MVSHSNLHSSTDVVTMLVPLIRTADAVPADGSGCDTADCDAVELIFLIGTNADTYSSTDKLELEVQESDTDVDGNYTAVANADLTNYVTGTNVGTIKVLTANSDCSQSYSVGYRGSKRYVRGRFNYSGTHSTGTSLALIAIRGRKRIQPAQSFT